MENTSKDKKYPEISVFKSELPPCQGAKDNKSFGFALSVWYICCAFCNKLLVWYLSITECSRGGKWLLYTVAFDGLDLGVQQEGQLSYF